MVVGDEVIVEERLVEIVGVLVVENILVVGTLEVTVELEMVVVLLIVLVVLVDEQGRSQVSLSGAHFLPSKNVLFGQEQPSTLAPLQHRSPTFEQSFGSGAQVCGKVLFAMYPPVFLQGRQQGSSI